MTTREVYEKSVARPWEVTELRCHWRDMSGKWIEWEWKDGDEQVFIPDSLASSAMMRAMVEWFHQMTGEVGSAVWDAAVREHKLYYITAENLLLACQSLHGGAKRE